MREMLRIKRSVQATYNVQVNYMAAQMMVASMGDDAAANQVRRPRCAAFDKEKLDAFFPLGLGQLTTMVFSIWCVIVSLCVYRK